MTSTTKKSYLIGVVFGAVFLAATCFYITVSAAQAVDQNRQGRVVRGRVTSTYGPVGKGQGKDRR